MTATATRRPKKLAPAAAPVPARGVLVALLPGPDRKRTPAPYRYRVLYRHSDPAEPGCVMVWEVEGGREPYQVTLERTPAERHRWHCTCADAVYHGEDRPGHQCKHVRALCDNVPPLVAG